MYIKYITNFPRKTRTEKRKCTAVSEKITAALYILFFLLLKKNELCFKDIKASQCKRKNHMNIARLLLTGRAMNLSDAM